MTFINNNQMPRYRTKILSIIHNQVVSCDNNWACFKLTIYSFWLLINYATLFRSFCFSPMIHNMRYLQRHATFSKFKDQFFSVKSHLRDTNLRLTPKFYNFPSLVIAYKTNHQQLSIFKAVLFCLYSNHIRPMSLFCKTKRS